MNSDLSKVRVGDYVFTIYHGWVKVIEIHPGVTYPITTEGQYLYTLYGKHDIDAKYPSAFTEPPAEFNAGPRPSPFKKGDKVLVRNDAIEHWKRRYFSHERHGMVFCFYEGRDEWASGGEIQEWTYCKPWVEGADEWNTNLHGQKCGMSSSSR